MTVRLLADVHVRGPIVEALRANGVDVSTAHEEGLRESSDADILDRATALGRLIVTEDADFLRETNDRLRAGHTFASVLYIRQKASGDAACIQGLLFFVSAAEPDDLVNHVFRIPL